MPIVSDKEFEGISSAKSGQILDESDFMKIAPNVPKPDTGVASMEAQASTIPQPKPVASAMPDLSTPVQPTSAMPDLKPDASPVSIKNVAKTLGQGAMDVAGGVSYLSQFVNPMDLVLKAAGRKTLGESGMELSEKASKALEESIPEAERPRPIFSENTKIIEPILKGELPTIELNPEARFSDVFMQGVRQVPQFFGGIAGKSEKAVSLANTIGQKVLPKLGSTLEQKAISMAEKHLAKTGMNLGTDAARKYAENIIGQTIMQAGIGAAQTGGMDAASAYTDVMNMKPEELQSTEYKDTYNDLLAKGQNPEDAKRILANGIANQVFIKTAPSGIPSQLLEFVLPEILHGGRLKRSVKGFLAGAPGEALQEGYEQRIQNVEEQRANPAINPEQGVAESMLLGGLMGGLPGAAQGLKGRPEAKKPYVPNLENQYSPVFPDLTIPPADKAAPAAPIADFDLTSMQPTERGQKIISAMPQMQALKETTAAWRQEAAQGRPAPFTGPGTAMPPIDLTAQDILSQQAEPQGQEERGRPVPVIPSYSTEQFEPGTIMDAEIPTREFTPPPPSQFASSVEKARAKQGPRKPLEMARPTETAMPALEGEIMSPTAKQGAVPSLESNIIEGKAIEEDRELTRKIDQAAYKAEMPKSEAQASAGNYRQGAIVPVQGLNFRAETPRGMFRGGKNKDTGEVWRTKMEAHYGKLIDLPGADGDAMDAFIGPKPTSPTVFVVNQVNPKTKAYDENKIMIGWDSLESAKQAYMDHYAKGWQGFGGIVPMTAEQLKQWATKENVKKPAPMLPAPEARKALPAPEIAGKPTSAMPESLQLPPERLSIPDQKVVKRPVQAEQKALPAPEPVSPPVETAPDSETKPSFDEPRAKKLIEKQGMIYKGTQEDADGNPVDVLFNDPQTDNATYTLPVGKVNAMTIARKIREKRAEFAKAQKPQEKVVEPEKKETPIVKESLQVGSTVRVGNSPEVHTIERELPQTESEKELGEKYFDVKNSKGEIDTYEAKDLKPVKVAEKKEEVEGGSKVRTIHALIESGDKEITRKEIANLYEVKQKQLYKGHIMTAGDVIRDYLKPNGIKVVGKKTEKPSIKTTLTVAGKGGTPNEKAVRQEDADDAAAEAGQKEKVATTTVKLGGKTEKTAMPDTAQTSHFQKLKKELASLKGKNDEQSQKRRVNILDELESYQEETAPTPEKIKSDRQAADEFLKKKLTESQIAGVAVRQQEEIPKEVVKDAVEAAPGTTAKELKAQKKFLIEHVDEAIKDAPEEIEGLDRKVQQINDINNKAKAAYDKAANLRHYKKDEDQVQKLFSEREAFHRQAREIQATIPSVTIEVPNDGNFTVYNDKATLKKFKEIVAKQFPTTPEKAKNLTQPSGKARGYRAPSELEEGIDFKLNGKPAYTNGHLLLLGETKAIPETLAKRWGGADKETNQENRERLAEQAKRLFAENAEKAKLPVGKIKFVAIDEKPYNPADKKNDFPYGVADYPIRGEKQSTTVLISGDVSNAISTDYYQHIIDHYPDATFKIGVEMSKGDNISPVGVYSKGKHAGIVMPWRSSDAVQIAREHMQEESASGKTESVKAPKQEEIKSEAPREAPKYASRDSDFTKISDYISKNYGSKVNIPAFTSKLREMVKSATITAENAEKVIARLKATGEVTIPKSQVLEIAAEEGSNVTRQIKAERSGDNLRVPESYGPLELEAFRLVEEDLGRTIAPSSRISPIQKQVAGEWEKFTGTKILFANSNNIPFDGAVPKKGYIIVSDALDTPQLLSKVIGHELFHNIEHVAKLSPELEAKYKNFSEIARRLITDAKVKEFMEVENKKRVNRLGMKQLETVEEAWSEYGAHILGDAIRDKRFYERMYQQDRNLFEKFVDYIVGVFKKLKILSPDVVESEYYSPEQAVRLINESSDLFAQYLRVKDDFGVVSGESAQGPAYSTKPNQKSLDSIVGKWEKLGVAIDAFDYRNKKNTRIPRQLLSINRIEVDRDKRKRGLGTMAMHDLTDFADENGLRIELSPDDSLGATSKGRLKEFYKRFGFVENKGRNKDFRTSATMYREAITAEGQPLYAAQGIAGKGMSKHDAIFEMKKLDIDFDNLENFVVVENEARLPENIQNDMLSKGLSGTIEGAYDADANAFYIIAGNIASEKRLQQVVQHELVHKGLRNVLGPRIEPIFTAIGKKYRNEIREIADEYNLNVNKKTEMLTAVDEFIARYGEEYKEQPLIKRMIAIVRSWLRNHGFTVDWSDNDILNLAGAALKAEGMGEGVRYSFAGKKAKGFNEAQGKFSDLADRQERFEIDDNKAELQNIKLDSEGVANRTILLSEVLSHAELFKAYPEFKSMLTNISIDPSLEESNGRFDEGTPDTKRYFGREPEITVNARNLEEAKDVLLHEIQHALQVRENFAKGGMPTVGGATELKDRFEEMQDEYNRLKKKLWAERTTRENARFGTLENEIRLLAKRLEGESVDRYRRLSGEEEARRVSARADMTAEERLGTPYERTDLREGEERIVRREGGVAESKESGKIPPMTPKKGAGEKPTEKNPVTPGSGNQVYRSRGPEDAQLMREEDPNGSLANYDKQSQREWLRGANPPSDGKITLYRATPEGKEIAAGDYVTSSRKYAEDHIKNNLGGEGKISQISATLDDIYPADGPGEFWYAPKNILTEKPESKPEGGKWTAKGWVVDFNPQPILDKYGLKNGDEDILQKFAGEGGFISDLSRSQGERYNGLEQQGFIERKHQDVGPGELMGQGFPAKEVDRMILTDRGRELLSGIKRVHREAEKKFFDQLASSDSPRSPQSGDQAALSRSFQEGEENVQGNEGLPESQPGMGEVYGEPGAGREGVNKLRPASVGSEQGDRREDRTTRGANGPILSNPSFRKWFGNSVVTVDGKAGSEPLVVYHGSPIKGFEQFDKNKINPYDPDGPYNGFYFTSDEKDARRSGDFPWGRPNTKGGGETRAYYLALQNPATRSYARKVANEIANTWEQKYPEARSLNDAVRMDLQTRGHDGIIHEPYFVPSKEEFERSGKVSLNKFGRELRKSEEYPGGVDLYSGNEHITGYTDFNEAADMNRHGVFIAFEPTQIKSATGNTGEFSPENPNILYSKARGAKVASEATEKLTPYSAKPENNIFTEIASNPKRFYRSYRQSFADNDLSKLERLIGLPHWIAKNFADFDRVMDVEEIRQENRDTLRNGLLSARIKKNKDGMHEFLALPKESKKKVEKYLLKSDKENRVMNPDELKGLDTESKSAYYSWKRAMDAALELRMQWLEKMNLLPYEDKSWFESLKNVTSQKGKKNRDKTKKQVLSSIPEDSHRAFNEAYNAVIFGRTEIAKMRRQIGRIKFYVPHQREGNYVVDVHDPRVAKPTEWNEKFMGPWKGRLIWSERSTNKVKGTETLLRLQQKFPGMKMSEYVSKQVPEEIYQAISEAAIERFVEGSLKRAESKEGVSPEAAHALRNALFETVTDDLRKRGWERHAIHRSETWVGGYETENLDKAFVDYMSGLSGSLTKMEAAYRYTQALKQIDKKKTELYAYAQNYVKNLTRNQTDIDRKVGKAKAAAFFMYITGKLSMVPIQLTQNFVTGIPQLGRYTRGAGRKYSKAMADVATQGRISKLSPVEQAALKDFHDKGLDQAKFLNDIMGQVDGYTKGAWNKVNRGLGLPFFAMEHFNRKSAFLAAYRVFENKKNIDNEKGYDAGAFKRATDFVHDTHFQMGRANKPELAAGPGPGGALLNAAYTFNSFSHNFVLSLADGFRTGNAKEGGLLALRSLFWLTILGGMTSIPWWDDFLDIMEKQFGWTTRATERKFLRTIGGETLETFGMHGLPALLGFDLSGSMKTAIPFHEGVSETAMGVYGGLLEKLSRGAKSFNRGDYWRAAEQWSPLFLENAMKGVRMYGEPATTPGGRIVYDAEGNPITLNAKEAAGQFFGIRPEKVSTAQAKRQEMINTVTYYAEQKQAIYDEFALANTAEKRARVMKKVRQFNSKVKDLKGAVPLITAATLRQSIMRKRRPDKRAMLFDRAVQ